MFTCARIPARALKARRRRFSRILSLATLGLALLAGPAQAAPPFVSGETLPGTVVWRGDYENGFAGWGSFQEVAPDRPAVTDAGYSSGSCARGSFSGEDRLRIVSSPVRQGSYAARVVVQNGDRPICSSGNRTEHLRSNTNESEGGENYYRWSVMLASDFPRLTTYQLVTQWHGPGGGNQAPVRIDVSGDSIRFITVENDAGGDNWRTHWSAPANRGRWHDFVARIRWSYNRSVGFVELWHRNEGEANFSLVVPRTYRRTLVEPGAGVYLKGGYYRGQNAGPAGVVYLDGWTQTRVSGSESPPPPTPPPPSPPPSGQAPFNTALPTISGTAQQGRQLTATNGSWSNSPTSYTRQWRRCSSAGTSCAAISGATSTTYTATASDVGSRLQVAVTATNSTGPSTSSSASTAVVTAASGTPPPPPSSGQGFAVTSTIAEGQTLSGTVGWRTTISGTTTSNISQVEFLVDGTRVLTEYHSPYGDTVGFFNTRTLAEGAHAFTVRATARNGVVATGTVNATVANAGGSGGTAPPPPPPPSSGQGFAVTSTIAEGQTLSGTVGWRATISGTTTSNISQVEFLVDGTRVLTEYNSPYGDTVGFFNTRTLAEGAHAFTVRATARNGVVATGTVNATVANAGGSGGTAPPPPPPPPSGGGADMPNAQIGATFTDAGCSGCSFGTASSELVATIAGGSDSFDTAYGVVDLGGTGWEGRVWVRDVVRVPASPTLGANLAIYQMRDVNDSLVYELYISRGDQTIRLWSPAGGLGSSSINMSTGVTADPGRRVEVSALRNESVIVRVDGADRITLNGLSGASTQNQRFIRAGVDHYDTNTTTETIRAYHSMLGATTGGWLESRTTALTAALLKARTHKARAAATRAAKAKAKAAKISRAGKTKATAVKAARAERAKVKAKAAKAARPTKAGSPAAKATTTRLSVEINKRPEVLPGGRIAVQGLASPGGSVTIVVRDGRGHILGSVRSKASARGFFFEPVSVPAWKGQGFLQVTASVVRANDMRRTSFGTSLSKSERKLLGSG